jgi:hypothetical protein
MLMGARRSFRARRASRGQAMAEFMLVLPLFVMTFVGIIVLGMGVFFQQQVTNVAREGARFAAIHSQTAICPTSSNLLSDESDYVCPEGSPANRWPQMRDYARSHVFGLHPSGVQLSACWSGYWTKDPVSGNYTDWDALPAENGTPNDFRNCTITSIDPSSGSVIDVDPRTAIEPLTGLHKEISCTVPMPLTDIDNDMASAWSASYSGLANEVTVFACYNWTPPLGGFLLIPQTVTLRAVVTETLQYQQ